jgi:hypothetical protein
MCQNTDSAGYNPLKVEDCETNWKILQAFCPEMDYKKTFLQNTITMEWKLKK